MKAAALAREHLIIEKLLSVILNKVDMKKLKIYEYVASDGYYNQHYEKLQTHQGRLMRAKLMKLTYSVFFCHALKQYFSTRSFRGFSADGMSNVP
jgi:hypothetical protein